VRRWLGAAALVFAVFMLGEPAAAQDSGSIDATVFVDPLGARIRIQPDHTQQGNNTAIRLTVTNAGPVPLASVTATLLIDPLGVRVEGERTIVLARLRSASSASHEWRVCGAAPGNYLAMVVVTSGDAEGHSFRAETSALLLQVDPRKGRAKPC
jgi:hypothetical protein